MVYPKLIAPKLISTVILGKAPFKNYLVISFGDTIVNFLIKIREAYPECVVQDVQFAYDVRLLTKLEKQRKNATRARAWCEMVYSETGVRPRMR